MMGSVARARVPGPLAPLADGFRRELDRLGYTPASREYKVNQMSRLSRWLGRRGLGVGDIDGSVVGEFLADFSVGRSRRLTERSMRPLMEWLRAEGLVGSDPPHARRAVDDLMDRYRGWMLAERGLAARTIGRYEKTARRFLDWRAEAAGGGTGAEGLDAAPVIAFLLAEAGRGVGPGSLQGRVAELRSLLRFLYLSGVTGPALAAAVPPVPGWKDTATPRRVAAALVRALLDSCDRATVAGRRDLAMLLLLSRLGLRAAEVAGLRLVDFDWRAGELAVCGKGRRSDRMPLPADVGEAVASYVVQARPRVESGTVFLSLAAPPRPLGSTGVSEMVARRCAAAGLAPVRAHRLRHTLASDLLDRGFTLPEIAQVLRQRDLATTAIYAKVDHAALRTLARPWPAGAQ